MTNQEAIEILEEVKTLDDSMFAYNRTYNDAMNMAIDALKAQEPRVMTLEEVAKCSMCWLEDDVMLAPALFTGMERRANGTKSDVFLVNADSDDCEFWYDLDDYGKTWRCWTSRPDEKRRAETPWQISGTV